jgi:hypothetical protein
MIPETGGLSALPKEGKMIDLLSLVERAIKLISFPRRGNSRVLPTTPRAPLSPS